MTKETSLYKQAIDLMPTSERIEEFCKENDYSDQQRDAIFEAALGLFLETVKEKLMERGE